MKKGEVITLTDRGKVVGHVVPARPSPEEYLKELIESGVIIPAEGKLQPLTDPAPVLGDKSIADLLIEDRE